MDDENSPKQQKFYFEKVLNGGSLNQIGEEGNEGSFL